MYEYALFFRRMSSLSGFYKIKILLVFSSYNLIKPIKNIIENKKRW